MGSSHPPLGNIIIPAPPVGNVRAELLCYSDQCNMLHFLKNKRKKRSKSASSSPPAGSAAAAARRETTVMPSAEHPSSPSPPRRPTRNNTSDVRVGAFPVNEQDRLSSRNYVPPVQLDEDRIATTGQLIRSWSKRTTRLCLQNPTKSLSEEVIDKDPGDWEEVFFKELADLWKDEIACDVTFRVPQSGHETAVLAHRCIVAPNDIMHGFSNKSFTHLSPGKNDILVDDAIFVENPEYLRAVVGVCYGVTPDPATHERLSESGYDIPERYGIRHYLRALSKIDPTVTGKSEDDSYRPNVCIVGSIEASADSPEDYQVDGHKAILCAHSEYFRSLLTHEGWSVETLSTAEGESKLLLRLDSNQFTHDTVRELVSACYGTPLDIYEEPLESILQLIDGATYFGMKAVSLRLEEALSKFIDPENFADMIAYAQENGSNRLLLDCHKYLCRNLTSVRDAGSLKHVTYAHIEALLQSDFIETPEDDIMETVLAWSEETEVSFEELVELIQHVRLPFVPVDSNAMAAVVAKSLISEDMVRVCRLFQTDGEYRSTMINSETMYRPRQPKSITNELERKLRERPRTFGICRMLGTVNGRECFRKISSVHFSESGSSLICSFPTSETHSHEYPFNFDCINTRNVSTVNSTEPCVNRASLEVNRASLEDMSVDDARKLMAAMLQRENELRLHPHVQSEFGRIGENEKEMSSFVDALQAHVASEFNVDPNVGINLIRSASTLFPETAKLAHYVRFNRCFEGSLSVGDTAPDVDLSTLAGEPSTLWTELNLYQTSSGKTKPVLIVGASYT